MTDKQIIIDGVQFNKWGDFLIDYELNGIYKTISSSDKCYKILKSLIEQLKRKEQECKELKENETMLISNLQALWGRKIAEEQGDCKNIDYTKPTTREIYNTISEIERTLKDVAFAQSVQIGKTKPLGETGSPRSYRNWENKLKKSLEREFLK